MNQGPVLTADKLSFLAAPLYSALNQHDLTDAIEALDHLLVPHQAKPLYAEQKEFHWTTARRNLKEQHPSLKDQVSFSEQQVYDYAKSMEQWLTKSVHHLTKLLGDAPCGFSLLLLGQATALLGTYPESFSLAVVIQDDFYKQHPYFQALGRLVTFHVNGLGDGFLKLDASSIQLQYGVDRQWVGTTQNLMTRLLEFAPTDSLAFWNARELYANTSGKKLYVNYQQALIKTFDLCQQEQPVPLQTSAPTLSVPEQKRPSIQTLTSSDKKDDQIVLETKNNPPKPKDTTSSLIQSLSLGGEASSKTKIKLESKLSTEVKTSETKSVVDNEKEKYLTQVSRPSKYLQLAKTILETHRAALKPNSPIEVKQCVTALISWCQALALYFKYIDNDGNLLRDIPLILEKAEKENKLTPRFVKELQQLWNLGLFLLQKQRTESVQTQSEKYEKLRWLESHVLQPAYLAGFEAYENPLKTRRKKIQALEPVLFNIKKYPRLDLSKLSESEKQNIGEALKVLAETTAARQFTINEHLHSYRQIPSALRTEYRKILQQVLQNAPHAQEVLRAMQSYPTKGLRPKELFIAENRAWCDFVGKKLTQNAENLTESKSQTQTQSARLQWYRYDPKLEQEVLEEKLLHPAIQNQLFNEDGSLKDHRRQNVKVLPGQRLVIPLFEEKDSQTPIAYWKFFPQFPGMQVQATCMEQQITGHGLQFIVAKVYPPSKNGKVSEGLPVLISQPAGIDLETIADREDKQQQVQFKRLQKSLDPRHLGLKLLESILCAYEDHQPANLAEEKLSDALNNEISRLIGIDSDHVFQDPVLHETVFKVWSKTKLNRKNILYCLDAMTQPIDAQAVDEFLALDPAEVIKQMIYSAMHYEQQAIQDEKGEDKALFNRQELLKLFRGQYKEQLRQKDECLMPSGFKTGLIYELFMRFHALQLVLIEAKKKQKLPTPLKLLKIFEREIAHCYAAQLLNSSADHSANTLPPTVRFARVQESNPDMQTDISVNGEQKSVPPISSLPLSQWAQPSRFNPTKFDPGTQKTKDDQTKQKHLEETLRTYSKAKKEKALHDEINQAVLAYGSRLEHRYEIVAKIKDELENGINDKFLFLCQHPGLSYLIERILKKVDAKKMVENLGREKAIAFQQELLRAIIAHKHRFYELHLNHWAGLTDDLLTSIATHSKTALIAAHLSGCTQLSDNGIAVFTKQCPRIQTLDVSHCAQLTGKGVRAIAHHCEHLRKLDLGHLVNLHTLREVILVNRTSGPLVFKNLEHLRLDGCVNLNLLHTNIPKLKVISFKPYVRYDLATLIKQVAQEGIDLLQPFWPSRKRIRPFRTPRILVDSSYAYSQNSAIDFLGISCLLQLDLGTSRNHLRDGFLAHPEINDWRINDWSLALLFHKKNAHENGSGEYTTQDLRQCLKSRGISNFMVAAGEGDLEKVRFCLANGASVHEQDPISGYTAVMFASRNGHLEVVRLLLSHKANVLAVALKYNNWHERNSVHVSALYFAARNGHIEIVKLLLETAGNKLDLEHRELAFIGSIRWGNLTVVKLLFNKGFLKNHIGNYLSNAAESGNIELVQFLLNNGVLLSKQALISAAEQGHLAIVKLFLETDKQIYKQIYKQTTIGNGKILITSQEGVVINSTTPKEYKYLGSLSNAMLRAVKFNHIEVVKLLLVYGAGIFVSDDKGKTVLMFAAENGSLEMVRLLLSKKASVNSIDDDGKTALTYAQESGHSKIVKLLENSTDIETIDIFSEPSTEIAKTYLGAPPTTISRQLEVKFMHEEYQKDLQQLKQQIEAKRQEQEQQIETQRQQHEQKFQQLKQLMDSLSSISPEEPLVFSSVISSTHMKSTRTEKNPKAFTSEPQASVSVQTQHVSVPNI